jgi:hypothetical protein
MAHPRISDDPFFLIRMEPSRDHPADGLIRFIRIAPLCPIDLNHVFYLLTQCYYLFDIFVAGVVVLKVIFDLFKNIFVLSIYGNGRQSQLFNLLYVYARSSLQRRQRKFFFLTFFGIFRN